MDKRGGERSDQRAVALKSAAVRQEELIVLLPTGVRHCGLIGYRGRPQETASDTVSGADARQHGRGILTLLPFGKIDVDLDTGVAILGE